MIALAALAALPLLAVAQGASPPPAGTFEGITIGEPMAGLKAAYGDPVRVLSVGGSVIWRYLTQGNGVYLDVLVKNNLAQSITVVSRFDGVRYTDPKGMSFGMTPDQVRAKLGTPTRESTNADDGSLDLWYFAGQYAWIYEFHNHKLDFIQIIAAPALLSALAPGPAVKPDDGTSFDHAIWIRPSNIVANGQWIDVFLAANSCGKSGHWKQESLKLAPDATAKDPLAYTIVHASCTEGKAARDFYFDTHGAAQVNGTQSTIYVDPNLLPPGSASPSSSPKPPHPYRRR
ncbi:MAG TPA: hypothetical protein VHR97_02130 [Candidatus Baltobacteraceae bacterium]|jgi:hypothetical protein|nr:hypothetical protein [Candidatus Baltobacteraceae bacterium]